MQVEVCKEEVEFQPVSISILLESQEELCAARSLFGRSITVPDFLEKQGVPDYDVIAWLMGSIHKKLLEV
jgi:hypothetical protein